MHPSCNGEEGIKKAFHYIKVAAVAGEMNNVQPAKHFQRGKSNI